MVISGYHHHAIMANFNNGYYLTSLLESEYNNLGLTVCLLCVLMKVTFSYSIAELQRVNHHSQISFKYEKNVMVLTKTNS